MIYFGSAGERANLILSGPQALRAAKETARELSFKIVERFNRRNVRNRTSQSEFFTQMAQVTYQTSEMAAARDAEELRARGQRMLELATRASCEQNYDFARLLTQLATEVFAHARDLEQTYVPVVAPSLNRISGARRR